MGHVAEQRSHGEQAADDQPMPGSELQQPVGQPEQPPQPDEQQLRQFQEFQEFQRFKELQRQAGSDITPAQPRPPAKIKAPRWLRWLGKKVLGWVIFALLTALALTWAYNYFLGEDEQQPSAAKTGGGTYHVNEILPKNPYEAVRTLYASIAKASVTDSPKPRLICGSFNRSTQQAFAEHLGYPNCKRAALGLAGQVDHVNAYAESIPSSLSQPLRRDRVRINSCDFGISGGPALGTFTVRKVERGQWLIVGHSRGPRRCPAGSAGAEPTH